MTDYTKEQYLSSIEAILFTMGNAVELKTIAAALEIETDEAEAYVQELIDACEKEDRGVRIIRLDDAYQMCTKGECYDALIRIASQPVRPVLTEVMLEVLSIVAYKQPVTRAEIERIRGVSSDYTVNRLVEFRLIEEAGRLDAPGRPILFRTTEDFLRRFGLSSVRELPEIDDELLSKAASDIYRESGFEMEGQMSFDLTDTGVEVDI